MAAMSAWPGSSASALNTSASGPNASTVRSFQPCIRRLPHSLSALNASRYTLDENVEDLEALRQ
jgi:hypothetical protein